MDYSQMLNKQVWQPPEMSSTPIPARPEDMNGKNKFPELPESDMVVTFGKQPQLK